MIFRVLQKIELETLEGIIVLSPEQVIRLSESETLPFIEDGIILPVGHIYSNILKANLWAVDSDEVMKALRKIGITEPIYTAYEIRKLKGMDAEGLKAVHRVKEVFENSKIEGVLQKKNDNPMITLAFK